MDEKPKIEMDISNVMFSLVPNAIWSVKNGVLRWNDNSVTQPTEAEIQTEMIRLQAEYDATQYQRDRQYPTWQEQMDMQYHDEIDGTTTWKDAVAKVKADNPKPE